MKASPLAPRAGQQGFAMLEIVCAMLIFSVGILGLVKLQAVGVQQSSDARYRAIAALQVGDLLGKMWVSDRTPATLQANFGSESNGSGYASWLASVKASELPGVAGQPPTVSFTSVPAGGSGGVASSLAQVTIYWKAPGEAAFHKHVAVAQVK